MRWLQFHLDHLVKGMGGGANPKTLIVCISLATALAMHYRLQGNLHSGALGWMQFWRNQDPISKQKAESGYWYVTNYTYHIPLPSSLSFHVHLFVYLIMLHTGQFLPSFHDLSRMRFLCVISSNTPLEWGVCSMWPVLSICCPFSILGALGGWTELGNLYL